MQDMLLISVSSLELEIVLKIFRSGERCEEEIPPIMSKAEWLTTIRLFEQKRNGEIPPKN